MYDQIRTNKSIATIFCKENRVRWKVMDAQSLSHFSPPVCGDTRGRTRGEAPRAAVKEGGESHLQAPSCREGVGESILKAGLLEKGREAELAQLPLGTSVPWLCPAARLLWIWQETPALPSLKTPLSPVRHDWAPTVLRQQCFLWKTHLYCCTNSLEQGTCVQIEGHTYYCPVVFN